MSNPSPPKSLISTKIRGKGAEQEKPGLKVAILLDVDTDLFVRALDNGYRPYIRTSCWI